MNISVSSYSFSQYISAGKMTLIDCISKAKALGFSAIEFTDLPGGDYQEKSALALQLKEKAADAGIPIVAYTVYGNLYKNDRKEDEKEIALLKEQIDLAHLLGVGIFRHDACHNLYSSGRGRSFDLMLPALAASARTLSEYAAGYGIRTCVENHGFIAQDSDRLERLFAAVDHENFGLLIDIGNFCCADENSVTAVSRLAPYAVHVHAKDMYLRDTPAPGFYRTRGCGYFKGAVLGEGNIDVRRCIAILRHAGYDGCFSLEFEGEEDCIEGISKGRDYLRSCLV